MKLYTEEQVREMIVLSKCLRHIKNEELLNDFTPIELPSDEEIEQIAQELPLIKERNGFRNGAKYVIDKIQGGNK